MALCVIEIEGLEDFFSLKEVVVFLAALRGLKLGSALVLSFPVCCIRSRGRTASHWGRGKSAVTPANSERLWVLLQALTGSLKLVYTSKQKYPAMLQEVNGSSPLTVCIDKDCLLPENLFFRVMK